MSRKQGLILGYGTFMVLLYFSYVFYLERTIFFDVAFHLFSILKEEDFAIQNYRFGAFFTQLFPLIGSKMGCSLETLAKAYSTSFVWLQVVTFFIIQFLSKNIKINIAYLLTWLLMTTHTFYWIQSEQLQAISFLFIWIALLDVSMEQDKPSTSYYILAPILLVTICFLHPLSIFPFFFVLGFYYLSYPNRFKMLLYSGAFFLLMYLIKLTQFKSAYDSGAMSGIGNVVHLFPHYIGIQANKNFLLYCVKDYYLMCLMTLVVWTFYAAQQAYFKLLFSMVSVIGYIALINLCYASGTYQFYIESHYIVLSLMVGLPFAFDVMPQIKPAAGQTILLTAICAIGLFRIYQQHPFYTNRVTYYRTLLHETNRLPEKKRILSSQQLPIDTILYTWGMSYECWLLSTIEQGVTASIVAEEAAGEFDYLLPSTHRFIGKWQSFDYATFTPHYFVFKDTSAYVK